MSGTFFQSQPKLHRKFATMNGEAAVTMMHAALKLPHSPHPWDDLWRTPSSSIRCATSGGRRGTCCRCSTDIDIPVYLGCDWQNVPLHLPSTFRRMGGLGGQPECAGGMLGEFGLTWPWESLHLEALAWFDHWLKGRDTGIMDGPPIRYVLPGADGWHTADHGRPPRRLSRARAARRRRARHRRGRPRGPRYMTLGAGLNRAKASPIDPPCAADVDQRAAGPRRSTSSAISNLRLIASATAVDTAWIATLQDVAADGTATDVTAGMAARQPARGRRAASRPVRPCCRAGRRRRPDRRGRRLSDPVGHQRPPLRRRPPHSARPHQRRPGPGTPAIMNFRHASVGTSSLNTSPLVVPAGAARPRLRQRRHTAPF